MSAEPADLEARFREQLLAGGLSSRAELDRAAQVARQRATSLPETVVALGLLTEDQVGTLLAQALSVSYVFPSEESADPQLFSLFPAELLRRRRVVPFCREEDVVNLATSSPETLRPEVRQEFEAASSARISFALASRRRVDRMLLKFCPDAAGPQADQPRPADDPTGITLLYGHLVRALAERATEVRFEPLEGRLVIRYRIGGELRERGREPQGLLFPLAARARVLLGDLASETASGALGTLQTRVGGRDLKLDVAILAGRMGDAVLLKLAARGPEPAAAPPSPAPPSPSSPAAPAEAAPPIAAAPTLDAAALLLFTRGSGASDLHLSAGAPPMIRSRGEMRKLTFADGSEAPPLKADDIRRIVFDILTDAQKSRLEAEKELDFSMTLGPEARFRGNVFFQDRGLAAVFRVIPTKIKTCDELGLPAAIKALAKLEKGLVLCTGPTGSGKSTTLAAMVDLINSTRRGHILTVEDPIEFVHVPKLCMVNQREVGPNTQGFARALRSALREDPDVILVGEMRDLETIALAITAAETGHLVLGTLHTSSAAKTVDRMINVFPAGEQAQIRSMLADSLQGVIAQILLPKAGGRGRVAAHEILVATMGVRSLIREDKTYQIPSAIQTGIKYGMQSLEQNLNALCVRGLVERSVVEHTLVALGLSREEAPEAPAGPAGPAAGGETAVRRGGRPF